MGFVRRYRSAVLRPATVSRAMAERKGGEGDSRAALPLAAKRFKEQVCVYCGKKGPRLRTGLLAISGPVWFCKKHEAQYETDKPWEEGHKREMGG